MTKKIRLETKFIVTDDMDESNVKDILNEYFGDLVQTERFLDARVVEDTSMSEAEAANLVELLDGVQADELRHLSMYIDRYTDESFKDT